MIKSGDIDTTSNRIKDMIIPILINLLKKVDHKEIVNIIQNTMIDINTVNTNPNLNFNSNININANVNANSNTNINLNTNVDIIKILVEINNERKMHKDIFNNLMKNMNEYENMIIEFEEKIKRLKVNEEIIKVSNIKTQQMNVTLKKIIFDLLWDKYTNSILIEANKDLFKQAQQYYDKGIILKDEQYHSNFFNKFIELIYLPQKNYRSTISEFNCENTLINNTLCQRQSFNSQSEIFEDAKNPKGKIKYSYDSRRYSSNAKSNNSANYESNRCPTSNSKKSSKPIKKLEVSKLKDTKRKASPAIQSLHKTLQTKVTESSKNQTPLKRKKSVGNQKNPYYFSPLSTNRKKSQNTSFVSKSNSKENQIQEKIQDSDSLHKILDKINLNLDKDIIYSKQKVTNVEEAQEYDSRRYNFLEYSESDQSDLQFNISKKNDSISQSSNNSKDIIIKEDSLSYASVKIESKAQAFDNLIDENEKMLTLLFNKRNDMNKPIENEYASASSKNGNDNNMFLYKKNSEKSLLSSSISHSGSTSCMGLDVLNQLSLNYEQNVLQDIPLNIKTMENNSLESQIQSIDASDDQDKGDKRYEGDLTLADLDGLDISNIDLRKHEASFMPEVNFFSDMNTQFVEAPSPRFGKLSKFSINDAENLNLPILSKNKQIYESENNPKLTTIMDPKNTTNNLKKIPSSMSVTMGTMLGKIKPISTYQNLKPLLKKKI